MKSMLTATGLALTLLTGGVAAHAANSPATPSYAKPVIDDANVMKGADELRHTSIRQQLEDQLTKAGYSAVTITPSAFFVQAKDKQGNAVEMVIGPESVTEVTEVAPKPELIAKPSDQRMQKSPATAQQK
jgi:hypothetical protein